VKKNEKEKDEGNRTGMCGEIKGQHRTRVWGDGRRGEGCMKQKHLYEV
jgi:hypothetical protein